MELEVYYMKKIVVLFFGMLLVSGAIVFAEDKPFYSYMFVNKFMHCLPSTENVTMTDSGGNQTSVKRVLRGWKESKCQYFETVTQNNVTKDYSCRLSRDQVSELIGAMQSDPNGEGVALQTWERYKKNTEVCQVINE